MKEVSFTAVQQKERDFKEFKKQFFSKTRKKVVNRPKFKSRYGKQSFKLCNTDRFSILTDRIRIEKMGWINFTQHQSLPEVHKLISVTISKDSLGDYYVSILVETDIKQFEKTGKSIGIDVGIKEFATLSDGTVIHNPKYFRENQSKLKRSQQHLSRKKKGSIRHKKQKLKVAKIHKKIQRQRELFLYTTSLNIVKNYDVICIEDLNVSGMVKNRKLAKSISDAGFSTFFRILKYKSEWYGKELVQTGRFEPTSKTCSNCGNVKKELKLSERTYHCEVCKHSQDRDLNAAINIKALGVTSAQRA